LFISLLFWSLVAVAASALQSYQTSSWEPLLFMRLATILLGIWVLYRLAFGRRRAAVQPGSCRRCGSRTFETLRSQDRRPVTTCFACGFESMLGERLDSTQGPRTRGPSRV
jgi:ribosomal protein L37E